MRGAAALVVACLAGIAVGVKVSSGAKGLQMASIGESLRAVPPAELPHFVASCLASVTPATEERLHVTPLSLLQYAPPQVVAWEVRISPPTPTDQMPVSAIMANITSQLQHEGSMLLKLLPATTGRPFGGNFPPVPQNTVPLGKPELPQTVVAPGQKNTMDVAQDALREAQLTRQILDTVNARMTQASQAHAAALNFQPLAAPALSIEPRLMGPGVSYGGSVGEGVVQANPDAPLPNGFHDLVGDLEEREKARVEASIMRNVR